MLRQIRPRGGRPAEDVIRCKHWTLWMDCSSIASQSKHRTMVTDRLREAAASCSPSKLENQLMLVPTNEEATAVVAIERHQICVGSLLVKSWHTSRQGHQETKQQCNWRTLHGFCSEWGVDTRKFEATHAPPTRRAKAQARIIPYHKHACRSAGFSFLG